MPSAPLQPYHSTFSPVKHPLPTSTCIFWTSNPLPPWNGSPQGASQPVSSPVGVRAVSDGPPRLVPGAVALASASSAAASTTLESRARLFFPLPYPPPYKHHYLSSATRTNFLLPCPPPIPVFDNLDDDLDRSGSAIVRLRNLPSGSVKSLRRR